LLFNLPFAFGGGQGTDSWKFAIDTNFFAANVGSLIEFFVTVEATNGSGQPDGSISFFVDEVLQPFDPAKIQNDYYGIARTHLLAQDAQATAHAIDISATTETDFVNGLLQSAGAETSIPMVAVEGSMYNHVGSAQEIDGLVLYFLPAQVDNAAKYGLNQQVYACEVLGLAFAGGDENHATTFATSYGPSNGSMPNTAAGDAAFASAASQKIFGSAALEHTPDAIANYVAN
jgi:hypothetical protein